MATSAFSCCWCAVQLAQKDLDSSRIGISSLLLNTRLAAYIHTRDDGLKPLKNSITAIIPKIKPFDRMTYLIDKLNFFESDQK
jgi:hypothetical protein